jgi:homopolymeric O-antigen transport system ATP-binding protein
MNDIAISIKNLSKKYRLYDSPQHRLKEALHPFRKKYHRDFWALKDISFEVKKGETVGIVGKNGSGKSTLLQIICGTLTATEGEVSVNGRVAALLELGAGFAPEFTGRENVYMNAAIMGLAREEVNSRFDEIAGFADIGDFIDQPVKTYSSGMYVRLAFAVAVCVDPEILVVDEALSVGDMAFQQKCLDRLKLLREKGITILLVTHDIMLTRNYCDSVVYLQSGNVKLIADAETAGESYIKDMQAEMQKLTHMPETSWKRDGKVRFGNNEGKITAVEAKNQDTNLPVCSENDLLAIMISARINKSILYPRIFVQIRDFRGYIIYGTHTEPDDLVRFGMDDYVELSAALSLTVMLGPGEYGVTVSLNNSPGEMTQTILDKQVGAATFTVISAEGKQTFHGAVNLKARWEKKKGGNTDGETAKYGDNDIGDKNLQCALSRAEHPEVLRKLVNISRERFGWFTKHLPRAVEYPWIFVETGSVFGKRILDIGAGVSPLPIFLAESGAWVVTVDHSSIIRDRGEDSFNWNEWGAFDYGAIAPRLTSIREDILSVSLDANSFDCIYSVSVVEHLLASDRRELWRRTEKWLKQDGVFLLTVDLVPGTDFLWNLREGVVVEPCAEHGNLDALVEELSNSGLGQIKKAFLRGMPDSRVDIAMLGFVKDAMGL